MRSSFGVPSLNVKQMNVKVNELRVEARECLGFLDQTIYISLRVNNISQADAMHLKLFTLYTRRGVIRE